MLDREIGQARERELLGEREPPVRERLRARVHRQARAGLQAVHREREAAGQERRARAPHFGRVAERSERDQRRGRDAHERVDRVPDRVERGHFVGDELGGVEQRREPGDRQLP